MTGATDAGRGDTGRTDVGREVASAGQPEQPIRPLERRRVALVLATSTGGVGQHVQSVVPGLTAAGAEVRVHGPAGTQELFRFTDRGARFAPVEIASGLRPLADLKATARLRRLTADADLIHAHGLRAATVAIAANAGRSVPVVVTLHNQVLESGRARAVYARIERVVARRATVVLGASQDLVDRSLELGGRDVRLGEVAAPALPEPSRPAADVRAELRAQDRPLILCVARLHDQKGLDVLVAAAAGWRHREPAPLVAIAGDGPLEAELRAMIAAADAPVELLGRRSDVSDLLAAADLVVLPSLWEARSLVVQEALRAGRPVVTTAVGGIPGLVGDGAALVPAGDVDALSAAVEKLLDDPAERARLAAAGAAQAASWPSLEDTTRQLVAVYGELLGAPGNAG